MKIANWNLERAGTPARRRSLRMHVDAVAADVWVFTETHAAFDAGMPWSHSSSSGRDDITGLDGPEDLWVSICSRYRVEALPVGDAVRTAAARVYPEGAAPFVVFGTVLPWGGDNWRGHASAGGVAFREALKLQTRDWFDLRRRYAADEFFVMGDFNQDLVEPRYYGSRANRDALLASLHECGLVALTGGADDPIRRDSAPWACIDHICTRRDSRLCADAAVRWPDAPRPDKRLSDHFGVAVSFG